MNYPKWLQFPHLGFTFIVESVPGRLYQRMPAGSRWVRSARLDPGPLLLKVIKGIPTPRPDDVHLPAPVHLATGPPGAGREVFLKDLEGQLLIQREASPGPAKAHCPLPLVEDSTVNTCGGVGWGVWTFPKVPQISGHNRGPAVSGVLKTRGTDSLIRAAG